MTFSDGTYTLMELSDTGTTGNLNISGSLFTGGTERLDSSGNLSNIGTISSTYLNTGASYVDLVSSAELRIGGTQVITSGRALNNITGYTQSSGDFSISGTGTFSTGTGAVSINGAATFSASATFNGISTFNTDVDFALAETENFAVTNTVSGTNTVTLQTLTLTNNTTGGTQRVLSITADGSGVTENGLVVNYAGTGSGTTAIEISGTWGTGLLTNNNSINAGTGTITGGTGNFSALNLTGALTVTTSSTPQLSVRYDANNRWDTSVSSVGAVTFDAVGTGAAFTFSDNTTISGNLTVNGNTTLGDASGDTVTVNSASWTFANDTNFILSGGVNGLSFDTDTLSIDAANGRVGIGTTSPESKLHIDGGTNNADLLLAGGLTNTYGVAIATKAGSNAGHLRLDPVSNVVQLFDNTNAFELEIWNGSTQTIELNANGNSYFNSGNVGIGTTTPQDKLDIRGDLLIPAADTVVDCDGSSSTGSGTCDSISDGTTLVSMGSDKLDFNNDGAADGQPLCTDSLTSPTIVAKDNDNDCSNGAGGTAILGTPDGSETTTVDSSWAFKDDDGDSLLDDGEDLYIDNSPPRKYFATGGSSFFVDSGTGVAINGPIDPNGADLTVYDVYSGGGAIKVFDANRILKHQFGGAAFNVMNGAYIRTYTDDTWTTKTFEVDSSTGNAYFAGNVGIGTTEPDFKLDVSGDIRIEGSNKLYFGGTGAADNDVNLYRSTTDVLKTDDNFDALALRIGGTEVLTSGRVLQNISSISQTLLPTSDNTYDLGSSSYRWSNGYFYNAIKLPHGQVVDNVPWDGGGGLELNTGSTWGGAIDFYSNPSGVRTLLARLRLSSGAVGLELYDDSARVLFGSASDVNLYRSAANTLKTDDSLIVAGTITSSSGTSSLANLTVSSSGTSSLANLTVTGNLTVNGNTTLGDASGDTVTVNSASWTFANDTNFILSGGVNGLSFDGSTLSIDATNNRIGIGTTSPRQLLHISKSSDPRFYIEESGGAADEKIWAFSVASGTLYAFTRNDTDSSGENWLSVTRTGTTIGQVNFPNGNVSISGNLTVNGNTTLGDASGDTLTFNTSTLSIPNNLNIDSNTLFIDAANNRVGIGTASPGEKLDIHGDNFGIDRNDANYGPYMNFYQQGTLVGRIHSFDGTYFGLYYGSTPSLGLGIKKADGTVYIPGNVGIGTTSPDFKLDVSGDIRIEGSNKLYFGGTGATDNDVNLYRSTTDTLKTDDNLVVALSEYLNGNLAFTNTSSKILWSDGAGGYDVNLYRSAANTLKTDDSLIVAGTITSSSGTSSLANLTVNTLFIDAANNRVGIGTASPVGELHVLNDTSAAHIIVESTGESTAGVAYLKIKTDGGDWSLVIHDNGNVEWDVGLRGGNSYKIHNVTSATTPFQIESNTPDNTLYLDSLGNVGIATASPDYPLQVNGIVAPEATGQDLGTSALRWDLYANTINADSTITFSGLTANRLVATDGSNNLVSSITADNLRASVSGTTGTGNLVFSASPTFTGTVNAASLTLSGTLTANGPVVLGDGGDDIAINSDDWDISSTGAISGIASIDMNDGAWIGNSNSGSDPYLTFDDTNNYFEFMGGNVGIGTTSPGNYRIYAIHNQNADAFYFKGHSSTTGEHDVFTIEEPDAGGGSQDESSVLKVIRTGAFNANDDASTLVELTYTGGTASDDRQFYILGRLSDEGAVKWGVDMTDADIWTTGGIKAGATGTDCGGTGAACFNNPQFVFDASTGKVGIGQSSPTSKLTVRADAAAGANEVLRLENLQTNAVGTTVNIGIYLNKSGDVSTQFAGIGFTTTSVDSTNYAGKIDIKTASNGSLTTQMEIGNPNIVMNRPLSVNVSGDVGLSYDLYFSNTGLSSITSEGPLKIAAGDPNHAEDLTLTTQGTGSVIVDIVDSNSSYGGFKILGSDGYVLRVTPSGNVGIGTTGPSFKLDVRGSDGWIGSGDSSQSTGGWRLGRWPGSAANTWVYLSRADSSVYQDLAVGALWAGGALRFGSADDLAEMTPVNPVDNLEPGDVVVIDDQSDDIRLTKSTKPYDTKVVGVVSDPETAALIIGGSHPNDVNRDDVKPIAIAGRVLVKVSTENGPIEIGDLLTSSSQPGVAMKATESGRVIGMALEAFDGQPITRCTIKTVENEETGKIEEIEECIEESKIMVFVNPHWMGNDLSVEENEEGEIVNVELQQGLASLGLIVNEYGVLEVDTLKANKVVAEEFEIRDKVTGEIWCAWIENGEWMKIKGDCASVSYTTSSITQTTTPPIDGVQSEFQDSESCQKQTFYYDSDKDGFGQSGNVITACQPPEGYVLEGSDCDDSNPDINPSAIEICDGIDNNCNSLIDEYDVCTSNIFTPETPSTETTTPSTDGIQTTTESVDGIQ